MVEFYGERSDESRTRFAGRQSKGLGLALLCIAIAGLGLALIFRILWNDHYQEMLLWSGLLVIMAIIMLFSTKKLPKKVLDEKILQRITFEKDSITHIALSKSR